jgi:hypothetical protein
MYFDVRYQIVTIEYSMAVTWDTQMNRDEEGIVVLWLWTLLLLPWQPRLRASHATGCSNSDEDMASRSPPCPSSDIHLSSSCMNCAVLAEPILAALFCCPGDEMLSWQAHPCCSQ